MKVTSISSLKEKYHQWRYWGNIYKEMVEHLSSDETNETDKSIPYINKPGIALSFDDSYRIHEWYKYGKDLLGYYDVKATFNINGIHPLEGERMHTQEEIDKLLELQSNGHEIGNHGFNHRRATEYASKYGYEQWIEDEIKLLIYWMEKQKHSKTEERFKRTVSFAFPHFQYNEEHIKRLIPEYFKISRGHLENDNLTEFNHEGFAPSICLDGYYSCNIHYLKKIIKLAMKTGKNLILTCHSILPEAAQMVNPDKQAIRWGRWRVTPKLLQTIIYEAQKNNMEFYTTSELAGIANFLDKSFETAVRKQLETEEKNEWIKISDLINIKKLDVSNSDISSLDGIQYFLGLESLNLSNNKITDFRLLKKIPNLKEVKIDGNPVNAGFFSM
jgi:peptidoglycan/xylan/chitin deacetylase (PgdA/CDA1 family)